jgi:hypothetical protein
LRLQGSVNSYDSGLCFLCVGLNFDPTNPDGKGLYCDKGITQSQ